MDRKYLVFVSDGHRFSMAFSDINIIVRASVPKKIPDYPDYVEGTIVNDGKVVTVINLRRRFNYGQKEITDRDCIIICNGDKEIGLLCDSISGFREISDEAVQPPPDVNEQANARFISGEFLIDGEPCYIVRPELIIREEDEGAF
jgi:purine-binding chemotaxis protein CheW